uniref:HSF_DOMAIN domain-containing protein n=1 Tax=Meloidogyne hapla TaxID=6305 RepID=A0A1I8C110_MELHA
MVEEQTLLDLQNFTLNSDGSNEHLVDNVRTSEIREFCKKIFKTLKANEIGYIRDWDLGLHIFEDSGIDPFKLSLKFGFNSFQEFLRSEHMKEFIEIDNTDGVTTYHYPLSEADKRTAIHREQAASFLELEKNRKIRMRNNLNSRECPNADRILAKRYKKRFGIEDEWEKEEEEREKLKSSKYAVGRGKQVYVSRSKRLMEEMSQATTSTSGSNLLSGLVSNGRGNYVS